MNSSPDLPISNAYTSRNSTGPPAGSDLSLGLSLSGSSAHQYPQQNHQQQPQSQQSSRPGAALVNPPSSYSRQDSYRQDSFRSSDSGYQPPSNFGTAGGPHSSSVSSTSKSSRQSDPYSMAQQPHYNGNGNGTFASTTSTPSRPPLHHAYSTSGAAGSPSVNRHSYTMGPGAGSSMSQPPRPVRSGTLPVGEHPGASYSNGMSGNTLPQLSIPPVPAIPSPSTPTSAGNSSNQQFVSTPTPLEQSLESKMNLGPTIPVQTDKDLPNGPPTVRARSGTKGSSKDKKSMFGVLSGE